MSEKKPILCLDFDGVIHSYSSGWRGAGTVSDPPVPGAVEFLVRATEHFEVHIFSSRSHQLGGIDAMKAWLKRHIAAERQMRMTAPLEQPGYSDALADGMVEKTLKFPLNKPPACVTIDDRALTFNGNWEEFDLKSLLAFKPWNKIERV